MDKKKRIVKMIFNFLFLLLLLGVLFVVVYTPIRARLIKQNDQDQATQALDQAENGEEVKQESVTETEQETVTEKEQETEQEIEQDIDQETEQEITAWEQDGYKLGIGQTEERELWEQTYVYPENIDDVFVIDVCLPENYDEKQMYPVVYLTDCYWRRGDYEAMRQLYVTGKTKEFILIGIGYPDDYNFDVIRERDLLVAPDEFLTMIVKGVIPYMETQFKVDSSNRTFCGASYGGYFMLYSLFQSDGLTQNIFRNYILASPTFWKSTKGESLNDLESEYSLRSKKLPANVYLSVGEFEEDAYFQQPIKEFVETVESRDYQEFQLGFQIYEGTDHYTVWVPTLLDGLTMFLEE